MKQCKTNKRPNKKTSANSTYKKLAVQWLNEALCFVSSSVLADSFVLRNRQLLIAANRCRQQIEKKWHTETSRKRKRNGKVKFCFP
jgi:hypothetical protein